MSRKSRKRLRFLRNPVDPEDLVEQCYRRHGLQYHRSLKHTGPDIDGIDFELRSPNPGTVKLQVKRSDNGETLGLILPLPEPVPDRFGSRLSNKMLERISYHMERHPHVRCFLFVACPSRHRTAEQIVGEIWRETQVILSLAEAEGIAVS